MGMEEGGGFRMGNTYLWQIHFDIWQNQYNIVKLNNKIKKKNRIKKKSRDITLPTNVHIFKVMVFLVVMYGCESGTIKKKELMLLFLFFLFYF